VRQAYPSKLDEIRALVYQNMGKQQHSHTSMTPIFTKNSATMLNQQNLSAYYNKPIKAPSFAMEANAGGVEPSLSMNQKSQFQSFVERFKT